MHVVVNLLHSAPAHLATSIALLRLHTVSFSDVVNWSFSAPIHFVTSLALWSPRTPFFAATVSSELGVESPL